MYQSNPKLIGYETKTITEITNPRKLITFAALEQGFATACQTNLNITIPTGITTLPANVTNVTSSSPGNTSVSAPSSTPSYTGVLGSPNGGSRRQIDWIAGAAAMAFLLSFC